jgi:hypothetical protein
MNVTAVCDRSYLDAGDRLDTSLGGADADLFHRRRGVVIGYRHHIEACGGRALDELERRASAIGRGRMEVEIDPG